MERTWLGTKEIPGDDFLFILKAAHNHFSRVPDRTNREQSLQKDTWDMITYLTYLLTKYPSLTVSIEYSETK